MIAASTLHALPPFKRFPLSELEVLVSVTTVRELATGEELCREGDVAVSCFLLVRGEVEIVKDAGAGPVRISRLGPGALLGQIALVDRRARSAGIRALATTTLLELPRAVFDRLLAAESPLALRFQEQVAISAIRQLRAATARVVAHLSERAAPPGADAKARLRTAQTMLQEWSVSDDELERVSFVPQEAWARSSRDRGSGRPGG